MLLKIVKFLTQTSKFSLMRYESDRLLASMLVVAGLLGCVTPGNAQSEPLKLQLGTATPGGGFQQFGQAFAEAVSTATDQVVLEPIATKGSAQNLELLLAGEVKIAQVSGDAAHQAFTERPEVAEQLAVLWVMYPSPGSFVVKADTPYRTIEDLKGKKIAWGTRASGLRLLAINAMGALGLDTETDFQPIILEKAAEGPQLVLDGKADALWGGGIGWPSFTKIANGPDGARFIAPNAEQVDKILADYPYLRRMSIPAKTYKGQDEPIDSIGLWAAILVRRDLPDAEVTRLCEAFHAAEPFIAEELVQGAFTTAANTAREVEPDRLHPGVKAFLREKGLLKE